MALRIKAERRAFFDGVSLYIYDKGESGTAGIVRSLELEAIPNDLSYVAETATLSVQSAQELMDSLWECGFRPSEGTGSAGAFAAQGKHLDDMRKLVFEK